MKPPELKARATPRQDRSRATKELVLQVAAAVLAEVGLEGFNTNLIAERAGVGPRAIYRYFPNKFAILGALARDLLELERAWVGDLSAIGAVEDWRMGVERAIGDYFDSAASQPGYAALRTAIHALPELQAIVDDANRSLQDDLAQGLRALGVDLAPARLNALCRTIIEASARILEIALEAPPTEGQLLLGELKRMVVNLLRDYLP